jgi:uncharacterized protein YeaO (DUF488 family)
LRRRYTEQLAAHMRKLRELRRREGTLTLVYAVRDTERNDPVVGKILRHGRRSA